MFMFRRTVCCSLYRCMNPKPMASAPAAWSGAAAVMARRLYSSTAESAGGAGLSALDVAMKVNKLKRLHQTGQGGEKKRLEIHAWKELNTLTETQINSAEGKAVALLLNSWAYFSKFWERGKEGPITGDDTEPQQAAQQQQATTPEEQATPTPQAAAAEEAPKEDGEQKTQ